MRIVLDMETTTTAKRMTGLTISCDHCENLAGYRHETKADVGYAVHWTCASHRPA